MNNRGRKDRPGRAAVPGPTDPGYPSSAGAEPTMFAARGNDAGTACREVPFSGNGLGQAGERHHQAGKGCRKTLQGVSALAQVSATGTGRPT